MGLEYNTKSTTGLVHQSETELFMKKEDNETDLQLNLRWKTCFFVSKKWVFNSN